MLESAFIETSARQELGGWDAEYGRHPPSLKLQRASRRKRKKGCLGLKGWKED